MLLKVCYPFTVNEKLIFRDNNKLYFLIMILFDI